MLKEVEKIANQVVEVYQTHTGNDFIGLIVHGSAMKGGFIKGSSDIDFQLFLEDKIFEDNGMLPLELYLKIHQDLAKINTSPFRYIQCKALSKNLPRDYVGPVSGTYKIVAGRLPVPEATNEQLKQSAHESLLKLTETPEYLSSLLDHGKDRLTHLIRLLCTRVSPLIYQILAIEHENAIQIWNMPKNMAIHCLPKQQLKESAGAFYNHANAYYPKETSIYEALEMVKHAVLFMRHAKNWYEEKMRSIGKQV
ncbi:hypothetical protein MK805_11310 [Shimazuella sp. AN120528]|uniref:hypothetical protein n=1 Tax=Shimazuella soli TaxID=1892854 RepID=UPI001F0F4D5E|nr:hypothetical protein [Shimazuella soli]MCH5585538.1 hypothetical protein [Shimazuella soli]